MEQKETHHSNDEIDIVWRPSICQHSGVCIKMLPKVYNPKEKPWIKVDQADTPKLIEQIQKCPSGALSYKRK